MTLFWTRISSHDDFNKSELPPFLRINFKDRPYDEAVTFCREKLTALYGKDGANLYHTITNRADGLIDLLLSSMLDLNLEH